MKNNTNEFDSKLIKLLKEYYKIKDNTHNEKISYNDFIQNIINTRGQWHIKENEYFEIHHILPVCLGGTPKKVSKSSLLSKHPNLIWLYPEEHYIAHKLLFLEQHTNKQIAYAWLMMAFVKSKNQQRYTYISESDYKILHLVRSQYTSENSKKIKRTAKWCSNISASLRGKKKGHWYNNGKRSILSENCPEGFTPGRLAKDVNKIINTRKQKDNYKVTTTKRNQISNTLKSKHYHHYTNGIQNLSLEESAAVPKGFYKGVVFKNPLKHYTNGKTELWLHTDDAIPEGFYPLGKTARKIIQFTKTGEFVKTWPSLVLAGKTLGISVGNIGKCCLGLAPSAGGYKWKYYKEIKGE